MLMDRVLSNGPAYQSIPFRDAFFVTNNLSNDFKIIERLETLALPEMQSNHQFGIEFRTL